MSMQAMPLSQDGEGRLPPVMVALLRIERKLDVLIAALAEEEADEPGEDLEGNPLPRARAAEDVL